MIEGGRQIEAAKDPRERILPYYEVRSTGELRRSAAGVYHFLLSRPGAVQSGAMVQLQNEPDLRGRVRAIDGERLTVAFDTAVDRRRILDHFKRCNDLLGHPAGDQLLRDASAAWRLQLRPEDLIARYGGEEFGLILHCRLRDAAIIMDRLREVTSDGQTFSAGLALWTGDESAEQLTARADAALYVAKREGRDQLTVTGHPARTDLATDFSAQGPVEPRSRRTARVSGARIAARIGGGAATRWRRPTPMPARPIPPPGRTSGVRAPVERTEPGRIRNFLSLTAGLNGAQRQASRVVNLRYLALCLGQRAQVGSSQLFRH